MRENLRLGRRLAERLERVRFRTRDLQRHLAWNDSIPCSLAAPDPRNEAYSPCASVSTNGSEPEKESGDWAMGHQRARYRRAGSGSAPALLLQAPPYVLSRVVPEVPPREFPDEIVAACVRHYKRPTRDHTEFGKYRRDGRSFPTDYEIELPGESLAEHWNRVVAELDAYRGRGPRHFAQSRQSVAADKRTFAGPSQLDAQELPHIEDAWCVAEFICAELGLRSDTWTKDGLRIAHLRYGMMLDWLTRDVAQRMARERGGIDHGETYERYGLDAMRVAMEHGAVPDELDEFVAAAGLNQRGAVSPFGAVKESSFRHERIAPESDPGFVEIAAIKVRLAEVERGA